jgi:hypothetical protein
MQTRFALPSRNFARQQREIFLGINHVMSLAEIEPDGG